MGKSTRTKGTLDVKCDATEEQYNEKCENSEHFEILTEYKDYKKLYGKLEVKCKSCENHTRRSLRQIEKGTMCWSCNARSKEERGIQKFLEEHGIRTIRNTRQIIPPYELDFYLPDYNVAIEYNGLYWHCDYC